MVRVLFLLVLAASGAWWYLERPTPVRTVAAPQGWTIPAVRGAIHVHSARSDGSGSPEGIATAAARAGLNFVVLTDHGDGTRQPDPPRYIAGVLCLDAVEISTTEGHVLALGLPQTPYPLGGEARDVLEDIARLGAFAIAAHPESPKDDLRWRDNSAPLGGLEWLNGDSEWRDETAGALARVLLLYPFHRTDALVSLLDRPTSALRRWDALAATRPTVGIAATDAHARLGVRGIGDPYDGGSSLHLPSYENTFRMFSNVLPFTSLTGDAQVDAGSVLAAIRQGRLYSMIDGLASPAALSFTATSGSVTASFGEVLPIAGPVTVSARISGPDDARIALIKDGEETASIVGTTLTQSVESTAAVYRVEVTLPARATGATIPWIVSNPIYVGRTKTDTPGLPVMTSSTLTTRYGDGPLSGWTVEHSTASLGALDEVPAVPGRQLSLRYALGGTASSSAFVAFVMPAGSELKDHARLEFTARANHPMRLSVQLREGGAEGERWHRSVYVGTTPRRIDLAFSDMRPRSSDAAGGTPPLDRIESVLFVIDTVNIPLGGNGTLWLDDVKYAR